VVFSYTGELQSFKLTDENTPAPLLLRRIRHDDVEEEEEENEMHRTNEGGTMGSRKRPPAKRCAGNGMMEVYSKAIASEVGIERDRERERDREIAWLWLGDTVIGFLCIANFQTGGTLKN